MTTHDIQSKFIVHINSMEGSGFTQIPNTVLLEKSLSVGAKMTYASLLHCAWHTDPYQLSHDTLADEMSVPKQDLKTYLDELQNAEYISVIDQ